jgi:hypothetical protein
MDYQRRDRIAIVRLIDTVDRDRQCLQLHALLHGAAKRTADCTKVAAEPILVQFDNECEIGTVRDP